MCASIQNVKKMKAAHYSPIQKKWIEANQKQFYSMARKYIDIEISKAKKPKQIIKDDGLTPFERMNLRRALLIERATKSEKEFYELMDLLNVPYEKQYPIRLKGFLYFADAYLPDLCLVIEIDGRYHDTEKQRKMDDFRTLNLQKNGYIVERFRNEQVHDRIFIFETLCKHGLQINAYLYT